MSTLPKGVTPPTDTFPWPTISVNIDLLKLLSDRTVRPGNQYEFGGKVSLGADSSLVALVGIDCSGYVRWLVHRATDEAVTMPDGSAIQHEWVREAGFKESDVASACLLDGALRIAFLAPQGGKAGHVALIRNGLTFESNGGDGPNRRAWNGKGWQAKTRVYVLTAPKVVA